MAEISEQQGSRENNAAEAVVRRQIRQTIEDPISLIFRDGMYKGLSVYLGSAITEVDGEQSAVWASQDGHSIRDGANFKKLSPRSIRLEVDFYSEFEDVSHHLENLYTMQEIDPETGRAPTLFYSEGPDISIAPLVCKRISYKKTDPFLGDRGFRHIVAQIFLEVLGGKVSDHKLGRPFTETELTRARAASTKQERERQGTALLAEEAFIACLGEERSREVSELVQEERLNDPGVVSSLPTDVLVQTAVAGLSSADTLQQSEAQVRAAIAFEMAKKVDGVGGQAQILARAILGGNSLGLAADLAEQLPQFQADFALIADSILKQDLSADSAVFSSPTANGHLISMAGCGLSVRPDASALGTGLTPEQEKFFEEELGGQASDAAARDQLILERLNKVLKEDAETIQKELGLDNVELAEAIKNAQPFESKDSFVQRVSSDSSVTGFSIWQSFLDSQASGNANSFEVES